MKENGHKKLKSALNEKINDLLREMLAGGKEALHINTNEGFMPFNIDYLGKRNGLYAFAFSHYYKHPSGDMLADPDMEVLFDGYALYPYSYQDSYGYQISVTFDDAGNVSEIKPKMQAEHASFLRTWLQNVIEQQYRYFNDRFKKESHDVEGLGNISGA